MAEQLPYFPFYCLAWLTGKGTTMMTPEQKGGFVDLLVHAWWNGEPPCTLVDDEEQLARLSGLGLKRWRRVGQLIRDQFVDAGDGRIRNRKLWTVYQEVLDAREAHAEAGRKGAAARWQRHSGASGGANGGAMPLAMPSAIELPSKTDGERYGEPIAVQNLKVQSPLSQRESTYIDRARDQPQSADPGYGATLHGKEHRSHAACGRPCVPAFLHRQFVSQLGESVPDPDDTLRAWYRETMAALAPDAPIPEPVKFWERAFGARYAAAGDRRSVDRRRGPSNTPAPVDKYAADFTPPVEEVDS